MRENAEPEYGFVKVIQKVEESGAHAREKTGAGKGGARDRRSGEPVVKSGRVAGPQEAEELALPSAEGGQLLSSTHQQVIQDKLGRDAVHP